MATDIPNILDFVREIRDLIFHEALYRPLYDRETTPALLVALRPNTTVYQEALAVFYKINEFYLSEHSVSSFRDLSASTQSKIHTMNVVYSPKASDRMGFPANSRLLADASTELGNLTFLKMLKIEVYDHEAELFRSIIPILAEACPRLLELDIAFRAASVGEYEEMEIQDTIMEKLGGSLFSCSLEYVREAPLGPKKWLWKRGGSRAI